MAKFDAKKLDGGEVLREVAKMVRRVSSLKFRCVRSFASSSSKFFASSSQMIEREVHRKMAWLTKTAAFSFATW